MMIKRKFIPACLALAAAACQQPANDSNIAIDNGVNAAEAANAEIETLPPDDSNEAAAATTPVIPAELRGRWGMVAADCTSTRGDAKGLITISEKTVKFYEALATLKEVRPATARGFSGQYDFSGEGQTWQRPMNFSRVGNTLKRADDEGNYSYTRCVEPSP